jgi:hypothetical protein
MSAPDSDRRAATRDGRLIASVAALGWVFTAATVAAAVSIATEMMIDDLDIHEPPR